MELTNRQIALDFNNSLIVWALSYLFGGTRWKWLKPFEMNKKEHVINSLDYYVLCQI